MRTSGRGRRPDAVSTTIGELLDVLPDLIALAELQDRPIIVDDPGTEHGRALLLSLGVTIREREETHA